MQLPLQHKREDLELLSGRVGSLTMPAFSSGEAERAGRLGARGGRAKNSYFEWGATPGAQIFSLQQVTNRINACDSTCIPVMREP